ncbi:MAG: uracil phosphoribosyltransferase [Christiangramia sp.]|nr:uracil phosphoribosyltransferase [Christiangramia sp.]
MKDFFYGIQWLFENILFYPLDALRALELESWFLANILNWIFMIVGFVAFLYWMKQLKTFNDRNEENRESTSHSFLG